MAYKATGLVFTRPEMNFGLTAKVHFNGLKKIF